MARTHGQSQRIVRPGLKKRRPPLACNQCYSKKTKCGRESPACSRCIRAGLGHECTYRSGYSPTYATSRRAQVTANEQSKTPRVAGADRPTGDLPLGQARCSTARITEGSMTHFKGQETSIKFYGGSYHLNFYQQFPELRLYIAQLKAQYPAINQIRDDIYYLTIKSRPPTCQRDSAGHLEMLLPTRAVTDLLVQTYIDRFELVNRVIHVPTFMKNYCWYWENPGGVSTAYLAQLLLILATASVFHPEISQDGTDLKTNRDMALKWIETIESWLPSSSLSFRPESSAALMTHCLLVIAKRANYVQERALWSSTGALVRQAMDAGYHREAGSNARISPFHREMRRRLWTTIVELDLQASIERGMPPSIKQGDFNTRPPLHLDDEAFQESSEDLPAPQSLDTWTNTSFQVALHKSLLTRLDVCALVNGTQDRDSFDQVMQLGERLVQALREIPAWQATRGSPREQQTITYVRSMLIVVLNQNLLLLHMPTAIRTPPTMKSGICRRARLDAAAGILSHYRRLVDDSIIADYDYRYGLTLAAFNLCHELYLSYTASGNPEITTLAVPEIAHVHFSLAENALAILRKRVTTELEGLAEFYILAMVIALVKSKLWPHSATAAEQEAADQVIRLSMIVRSAATAERVDGIELEPIRTQPGPYNEMGLSPRFSDSGDLYLPMFPDDLSFLQNDFGFEEFQI